MYKQVIVLRGDLKLSKGKAAAQAAHASLAAFRKADKKTAALWDKEGSKKVVLKTSSLEQMLALEEKCSSLKLPHAIIADAGLTEMKPGTITALGIGPGRDGDINKVTGSLALLK